MRLSVEEILSITVDYKVIYRRTKQDQWVGWIFFLEQNEKTILAFDNLLS